MTAKRCCVKISLFLLGLSFAEPAHSQEHPLPDAPQPQLTVENRLPEPIVYSRGVVDKKFLLIYGVLGASTSADYLTSVPLIGFGGEEINPLFGKHPTSGTYTRVGGAYYAGEVILGYYVKRYGQQHRWARYFWLIEPSIATWNHSIFSKRNAVAIRQ